MGNIRLSFLGSQGTCCGLFLNPCHSHSCRVMPTTRGSPAGAVPAAAAFALGSLSELIQERHKEAGTQHGEDDETQP
jgi:hypothetical protein